MLRWTALGWTGDCVMLMLMPMLVIMAVAINQYCMT
jgi:hypothetical protein